MISEAWAQKLGLQKLGFKSLGSKAWPQKLGLKSSGYKTGLVPSLTESASADHFFDWKKFVGGEKNFFNDFGEEEKSFGLTGLIDRSWD